MGVLSLKSLELVKQYRDCPVWAIRAKLQESGYHVKSSMVADMLQVVFIELELEAEKMLESLTHSS